MVVSVGRTRCWMEEGNGRRVSCATVVRTGGEAWATWLAWESVPIFVAQLGPLPQPDCEAAGATTLAALTGTGAQARELRSTGTSPSPANRRVLNSANARRTRLGGSGNVIPLSSGVVDHRILHSLPGRGGGRPLL